MNYVPCSQRTFTLSLAEMFGHRSRHYLLWLKTLLHRLGPEPALTLWAETFRDYDEALLVQILLSGWQATDKSVDMEQALSEALDELFPAPIEGVSQGEARTLIENGLSDEDRQPEKE
jgi:hypothetical protein